MSRNALPFIVLLLTFLPMALLGQIRDSTDQVVEMAEIQEESISYDRNIVKLNLLGIALNNYFVQYERLIGQKKSLLLGFRYMPTGEIPFLSVIERYYKNDEAFDYFRQVQFGNLAITADMRFYTRNGKPGARGFYIGPFLRYTAYRFPSTDVAININDRQNNAVYQKEVLVQGSANSFTGGILLGAQWRLGNHIYLDWTALGFSYGTISGSIDAFASLNELEQGQLQELLDDIIIPIAETTKETDERGGRIGLSGPWAGFRTSLSVGVKF